MKYRALIIWVVLAFVFCLVPSSCFDWFKSATAGVAEHHAFPSGDLLEWTAHAILMAGVAFHLVPLFGGSARRLFLLMGTMVIILVIAFSIEWFQGLLPESFSRGFSISDIWSSLIGGLAGALLGSLRLKKEPQMTQVGAD